MVRTPGIDRRALMGQIERFQLAALGLWLAHIQWATARWQRRPVDSLLPPLLLVAHRHQPQATCMEDLYCQAHKLTMETLGRQWAATPHIQVRQLVVTTPEATQPLEATQLLEATQPAQEATQLLSPEALILAATRLRIMVVTRRLLSGAYHAITWAPIQQAVAQ